MPPKVADNNADKWGSEAGPEPRCCCRAVCALWAVFCCVGALAIVDALEHVDQDLLGWWLCERQLPIGGLNGRPEKLEDVCYSWWCLSSLSILRRLHWIDRDKLVQFILSCQDAETGGISDRPGNYVDVFHTLFGIAGTSVCSPTRSDAATLLTFFLAARAAGSALPGLSLLGYEGLQAVNPVYCMRQSTIDRLGLGKYRLYA